MASLTQMNCIENFLCPGRFGKKGGIKKGQGAMHSEQYRDFDDFIGSIGDIEATMMMVNPTERLWIIDHANMAGIHVQLGRLGSGNIVEGQMRADGYMLYIPLSADTSYIVDVLTNNRAAVLKPSCEFCIATKADHNWGAIFVPTSLVASEAQRAGQAQKSDVPTSPAVRAGARTVPRLRSLMQRVATASISCPEIESSPAARCAMVELLDAASPVIA